MMPRDRSRPPNAVPLRLGVVAATVAVIGVLLAPATLWSQATGQVTGQVSAAGSGQPLDGAQVIVVGTDIGTVVGSDGTYSLRGVATGSQRVRVRMVGYSTATKQVTIEAGQSTQANFRLETQAVNLDEIVVTGQAGASRRREVGHSISTIGEQVEERAVNNMDNVLQGSDPSVNVISTGGSVGTGGKIRIRGVSSIAQSNNPLIYVDGIRIQSDSYRKMKAGPDAPSPASQPGVSSSPLNDINPANIERVEVIKGPAATTLYGTEASAGVIQIFTKAGTGLETEGTQWSLSVEQGLNHLPGSTFFAGEHSEAWYDTYGPESEGMWMVGEGWLKNGHRQNYSLSAQGMTGDVNYYTAGHYGHETGVVPKERSEEWGLRANASFTTFGDLNVSASNSLTRRDVDWLSNGNESEAFLGNVMAPNDYVNDVHERTLEFDFDDQQTHWTSGVTFNYAPAGGLQLNATLGYDYVNQRNTATTPFGNWFVPEGERLSQRYTTENRTIDLRSTYRATIGGVAANTSAGININDEIISEVQGHSTKFSGPHNPTLTSGAIRNVIENSLREINAGFYVQEQLGFGDRLFLTGGLRVDGNSSFGEDLGLEPYPKASMSYVISDEGFWPDFFEQTKIRAAYGESGKSPGYFDAQKVWEPVQAKEGQAGVTPSNRGNPELAPERSKEFEAGLEVSVADGRVGADFTVYDRTTTDALIPVPQDPTLGFGGQELRNVGEIANSGIELNVNTEPIQSDLIRWNLGFSLSTDNSEVVSLGESTDDFPVGFLPMLRIREGYPLPSYFGHEVANPNEVAEPEYTDEEFLAPALPPTNFSVNTRVSLDQNLILRAMGEYRGGHMLYTWTRESAVRSESWPPCFDIQQQMQAGDLSGITAKERAMCNTSPRFWELSASDASFFRMREVALRYRIPDSIRPSGLNSLHVSLSGRNLFIITDYIGLDPEAWVNSSQNNLFRYENNQVPVPKTFTVKVETSF